ncbi:MAG: LysR family transcriptional regulator [Deltaproteobacteria bacterium]|nr:LysR family transcriptional regulator [Deltaproteobacteria bacterium]
MNADIDNIATFVEVVRRHTLASAARHLGVPKSTVSRRLRRLEEQLETKLIHRDGRAVTPTTEGSRLYDGAVDAVDALEQAVAGIEARTKEPRGTVRVTAPADMGRMLLMPHFVRFLERYPDISLDLVLTNRFVDLVQEQVDVALRAGPVTEPNLIARRLQSSELHLAASSGVETLPTDIGQLAEQPFVLYRRRGHMQVIRLERGHGKAAETVELAVTGRVSVDDYEAMMDLVAAGQGLGLLPTLHVAAGERAGRLQRIFPEWSLPGQHVHLVYATRQLPERVRLLIAYLTEQLADGRG